MLPHFLELIHKEANRDFKLAQHVPVCNILKQFFTFAFITLSNCINALQFLQKNVNLT